MRLRTTSETSVGPASTESSCYAVPRAHHAQHQQSMSGEGGNMYNLPPPNMDMHMSRHTTDPYRVSRDEDIFRAPDPHRLGAAAHTGTAEHRLPRDHITGRAPSSERRSPSPQYSNLPTSMHFQSLKRVMSTGGQSSTLTSSQGSQASHSSHTDSGSQVHSQDMSGDREYHRSRDREYHR